MKKKSFYHYLILYTATTIFVACSNNRLISVDESSTFESKNPALERVAHRGKSIVIAESIDLQRSTLSTNGVTPVTYAPFIQTESLYEIEKDGVSIRPIIASSLPSITGRGTVYRVSITPGRKFNNGTELTADDVLFSYQAFLDPSATLGLPRYIDRIVGARSYREENNPNALAIRIIDQHSIEFTFRTSFEYNILSLTIPIVSKADHYFNYGDYHQSNLSKLGKDSNPLIASGPYILSNLREEGFIFYDRNPYYNGPKKNSMEHIVLKLYKQGRTTASDQLSDLLNGTIDVVPHISRLEDLDNIRRVHYINFFKYLENGYSEIIFNTRKAPMNSRNMRKAISYATNQDSLMQRLYGSFAYRLSVPVNASWPGYNEDKKFQLGLDHYVYSPFNAINLLKKDGYIYDKNRNIMSKDGDQLVLTWLVLENKQSNMIYSAIISDLAAIGIKVDLKILGQSEFYDTIYHRPYSYDFFDKVALLQSSVYGSAERYHSKNARDGGANLSFFVDAKNDQLIDQLNAVTTEESYKKYFFQWLAYINEMQPTFVMFTNISVFSYNKRLQFFDPGISSNWWEFIEEYELSDTSYK